jgi:hypothetical protein
VRDYFRERVRPENLFFREVRVAIAAITRMTTRTMMPYIHPDTLAEATAATFAIASSSATVVDAVSDTDEVVVEVDGETVEVDSGDTFGAVGVGVGAATEALTEI